MKVKSLTRVNTPEDHVSSDKTYVWSCELHGAIQLVHLNYHGNQMFDFCH